MWNRVEEVEQRYVRNQERGRSHSIERNQTIGHPLPIKNHKEMIKNLILLLRRKNYLDTTLMSGKETIQLKMI